MSRPVEPETDPRFPSGRWVGFFIQKYMPPGKHPTELFLTFAGGVLNGEGRDWVGQYTVHGRYDLADGRCRWVKQYVGKHDVHYDGYNEGQGIWGSWRIPGSAAHGGFHIWPDNMPDPTTLRLSAEAEAPKELVGV